jgi:hypothetical protein
MSMKQHKKEPASEPPKQVQRPLKGMRCEAAYDFSGASKEVLGTTVFLKLSSTRTFPSKKEIFSPSKTQLKIQIGGLPVTRTTKLE